MLGTPYGESTDEEEDEEVDGGGEPLCVVSPTAKVKRRLSSHFTGSVSRRTRPRRVLKQVRKIGMEKAETYRLSAWLLSHTDRHIKRLSMPYGGA